MSILGVLLCIYACVFVRHEEIRLRMKTRLRARTWVFFSVHVGLHVLLRVRERYNEDVCLRTFTFTRGVIFV